MCCTFIHGLLVPAHNRTETQYTGDCVHYESPIRSYSTFGLYFAWYATLTPVHGKLHGYYSCVYNKAADDPHVQLL